ncbi:MAG: ATP phosphoribosyltransferase regulatory subunit [Chloroflexota bacterium]|nr:ATP phosphoribosyltransferase regulatory subunit [Chloroflexota bacterium]
MGTRQIKLLRGMRDSTGASLLRAIEVQQAAMHYLNDAGYSPVDTPLLEESELFVRKSGGELASRLYTFTDPGGHEVGLRPEFTPSIIRYFVNESTNMDLPARLQYAGPVFRYEPGNENLSRQQTQVGAELVGGSGVEFDKEIVVLAFKGLSQLGLDVQIRLGNLGVVQSVLSKYQLSEAVNLFIISNLPELKSDSTNVSSLKERAGMLGLQDSDENIDQLTSATTVSNEDAQRFVSGVLRGSIATPVGRRSTEQIVARLLRKFEVAGGNKSFEEALCLASELARVEGSVSSVLGRARAAVSARSISTDVLQPLSQLADSLIEDGIPDSKIILDLGIARGFSYYTGTVFELVGKSGDKPVSFGGGGRYDELVRILGGDANIPALGFAYSLDTIVESLIEAGL